MPEINIYEKMFVLERDYTKLFKHFKDFQNSKPAGVTFVGKKDTGLQQMWCQDTVLKRGMELRRLTSEEKNLCNCIL